MDPQTLQGELSKMDLTGTVHKYVVRELKSPSILVAQLHLLQICQIHIRCYLPKWMEFVVADENGKSLEASVVLWCEADYKTMQPSPPTSLTLEDSLAQGDPP